MNIENDVILMPKHKYRGDSPFMNKSILHVFIYSINHVNEFNILLFHMNKYTVNKTVNTKQ